MGILRSWRIIAKAFSLGFKELAGGTAKAGPAEATERTDRDLRMGLILAGIALLAVLMWVFFRFGAIPAGPSALPQSLIALAVVLVISFLFTSVAARAIAVVGTNPISGMTLMTLILTSIFLVKAGLTGKEGMLAALLIGGVVCTALSMAGGLITDLKIGYWIGATPAVQQRSKLLGTLVAALTVGSVILLLNNAYGFVPGPNHPEADVLVAPQANAMAAVIKTLMSNETVPWLLYGVGALIAMTMQMIGVPALAFALGMYIPQELNTPLVVGGLVAHFVAKSAKGDEKLESARNSRGMLVASGFIAGGAVMGVLAALFKFLGKQYEISLLSWNFGNSSGTRGELLALGAYICLAAYMYWDSRRTNGED
jgi:putative OPT family oligopeptide transporter